MKQRSVKQYWSITGILFCIAVAIKLFSLHTGWVEQYYATGCYVFISRVLRIVTGWLPFSLGDVLYTAVAMWMVVSIVRFLYKLFTKKIKKQNIITSAKKLLQTVLIIYIAFNILWGLNYNRSGIAAQLHLQPGNETLQDLRVLTDMLLIKVNDARKMLGDTVQYSSPASVFVQAAEAYKNAQQQYPFLQYRFNSVKASMFGRLGDYLGFTGYYNPFSSEAQVNATVPPFLLPYVTCHEMAHQLGYATEDEANFTGYLAAKAAADKHFKYSVYYDLFNYANSELFTRDSLAAKNNYQRLDTLVKKDIITERQFFLSYQNKIEPIITFLYGNYLKANNQPAGLQTYNEVVTWLIAYQKKYGSL